MDSCSPGSGVDVQTSPATHTHPVTFQVSQIIPTNTFQWYPTQIYPTYYPYPTWYPSYPPYFVPYPVPTYDPRVSDLERKVKDLEEEVGKLKKAKRKSA